MTTWNEVPRGGGSAIVADIPMRSNLVPDADAKHNLGSPSAFFGVAYLADVIAKGPVADVRAFGAKGDGVHNDTEAVINALNSPLYASIYFPSGTYLLSSEIVISSNKTLKGDNATFKLVPDTPETEQRGFILVSGASTVVIEGLMVDCSKEEWTSPHSWCGIRVDASENVRINNVTVKNVPSGEIDGGSRGVGIQISNLCRNIWVTNSHVTNTRRQAIACWNGNRNVIIANNVLESTEIREAILYSGDPEDALGGPSVDGVISNNLIRDVSYYGIRVAGRSSAVITGNHIIDTKAAPAPEGISGPGRGIQIYGSSVLISDNVIRGSASSGIYFSQTDDPLLTDPQLLTICNNHIINNGGSAIFITTENASVNKTVTGAMIHGNILTDTNEEENKTQTRGVFFSTGVTDSVVANNYVKGNKTEAFNANVSDPSNVVVDNIIPS